MIKFQQNVNLQTCANTSNTKRGMMTENLNTTVTVNESSDPQNQSGEDRTALNRQLAQMLKGGVIMDVTTPEQARIAEDSGACAVMACLLYTSDAADDIL